MGKFFSKLSAYFANHIVSYYHINDKNENVTNFITFQYWKRYQDHYHYFTENKKKIFLLIAYNVSFPIYFLMRILFRRREMNYDNDLHICHTGYYKCCVYWFYSRTSSNSLIELRYQKRYCNRFIWSYLCVNLYILMQSILGKEKEVEGTLSVQPKSNPVKGFEEYFLNLTVQNNTRNPWFVGKLLWHPYTIPIIPWFVNVLIWNRCIYHKLLHFMN